jgi:hypothetical protein
MFNLAESLNSLHEGFTNISEVLYVGKGFELQYIQLKCFETWQIYKWVEKNTSE